MLISTNWLQDFVDIEINKQSYLYDIIVGHVTKVEPHPNADKLNIAQVDIGGTTNTIVCGATNLAEGQKVPVALPGVILPGDFQIAKREIREVESNGMICSEDELGLTEDRQEGIMILPEKWEPGTPMSEVLNLKGLTAGQLGDKLTLHTAEVEEVISKEEDYVIDIDNKSLTHRPDLWGHQGIAREVAILTESKFTPYEPQIDFPKKGKTVTADIQNKEICNRFCTVVIEKVKVAESPDWLKARLEAVGINPINNIVDITNYVMLELGHPMHAFDLKNLATEELTVRFADNDEHLNALNEKNYALNVNDVVISNDNEILSLAGIIGGTDSGINNKTKTIVFEAANWNASLIRHTSTYHGIRTDASQRFEKSLDPELSPQAIARAVELTLSLCPDAEIAGPLYDNYPNPAPERKVVLHLKRLNNYIGSELELDQIKSILTQLGFQISKETKTVLTLDVPSWRAAKDVTIEADVIEEVARIYGYENIEPILPELPTTAPEPNRQRDLEFNIRYNLQGLGASEVYNYSFYSQNDLQNALLEEEDHLKMLNYLSENQTHLRTSMVPNFLHTIHENLKHRSELTIFELGRTYTRTTEFFPAEEKKLIIGCAKKGKDQQFFQLKGIVQQLLNQYYTTGQYEITATEHPPTCAHPFQVAQITADDHVIGHIYSLHPLVQKQFDLESHSISLCELNIGPLTHLHKTNTEYAPIPKFPDLEFDISVTVYEALSIHKLQQQIQTAESDLIHKVEVFDIYRGQNITEGKKSVAFHITLRAPDRTLTDEEMAKVQEKVFAKLEELGGEIRGRK